MYSNQDQVFSVKIHKTAGRHCGSVWPAQNIISQITAVRIHIEISCEIPLPLQKLSLHLALNLQML